MPEFIEVAFNLPTATTFTYRSGEINQPLTGCRVEAPFRNRKKIGYVVGEGDNAPVGAYTIHQIYRVLDAEPIVPEDLLALARWISSFYFCSLGEAIAAMVPGAKRESALAEEVEAPAVGRAALGLSDEQQRAVEEILGEESGPYYLRGITGSGKTEVFLRVAEQTLDSGRDVIYLVPEIALTHQLVEHLIERFGRIVGVIHSRLTRSQRLAEWQRIIRGDARFVVGARSAVFSPVPKLGLVIIDEEHEGSYKSNASPRYHARQVAMKRAALSGARVVMGSATPSVEAIHQIRSGSLRSLTLTRRLAGGAIPDTVTVDMKREDGPLSKLLISRIEEVHREGRQSILFLNRRGFSYFFHCRSCGYEMTCRQCSVTLTYHKAKNRMLCHYCGFSQEPVSVCPECGSLDVGYSGFGTEKIEETVATQFPDLTVRRVDTDSVKKRGELETVLGAYKRGEIDVLLGTQMVAKGLNFPGVKLVGIINADTGLNLPDFRSEERTFSLIVQVSGRAGRFAPDGEVIVQTFKPGNPSIDLAARGEIEAFYDREIEMRRELGFPPHGRLVRIVFRGKNFRGVEEAAGAWGRFLSTQAPGEVTVYGPAECALSVVSGNHRSHIILRSRGLGSIHRLVERGREQVVSDRRVHLEIDVDPVSLL